MVIAPLTQNEDESMVTAKVSCIQIFDLPGDILYHVADIDIQLVRTTTGDSLVNMSKPKVFDIFRVLICISNGWKMHCNHL